MTIPAADKSSRKDEGIAWLGEQSPPPGSRGRFLAWLKEYATLLSMMGVLIVVVIGASALLWQTTTTRFDDTATRIDDTKAGMENVEKRLTDRIKDVKTEVGKVEVRLGKRIDDVRLELRDARREGKADMNALRQDIQGLRQDISTPRDRP